MKLWTSLRTYFFAAMIMIGVLMVVLYSYISSQYYIAGIKNVVEWTMQEFADAWKNGELADNSKESSEPYPKPYTVAQYVIYPNWKSIPLAVRDKFPKAETTTSTYLNNYEIKTGENGEEQAIVYHLGKFPTNDGNNIYITRIVNTNQIPQSVKANLNKNWDWILYIGIITTLAFTLLVFLVFHFAAKPIRGLSFWASNLSEKNIAEDRPNFRYQELNNLAQLIQNSLLSVRNALDREQELLRNCSHELRTPIAVISNNLELIQRLHPEKKPVEDQAFARMQRATKTMTDLTDTLLRLSQNETMMVELEPVEINVLIEQLSDQLCYLLTGKEVVVNKTLPSTTLQLPKLAAQILLNNLIRNAYQHTLSGKIDIVINGNQIEIINDIQQCDISQPNEAGYGLGLKLCKKLADCYHWKLDIINDEHLHQVTVTFVN